MTVQHGKMDRAANRRTEIVSAMKNILVRWTLLGVVLSAIGVDAAVAANDGEWVT